MTDQYIFQQQIKKSKNEESTDSTNELYTIHGQHDFLDTEGNPRAHTDCDKVLAKKMLREDGTYKYIIKNDSSGRLYNPISIYGESKSRSETFLDKTCKDSKFRTVNMKTFELYVNFLRTKNFSWLYNAEREAE